MNSEASDTLDAAATFYGSMTVRGMSTHVPESTELPSVDGFHFVTLEMLLTGLLEVTRPEEELRRIRPAADWTGEDEGVYLREPFGIVPDDLDVRHQ
jgi:hypothetical protein